jgi:hypothetical protein
MRRSTAATKDREDEATRAALRERVHPTLRNACSHCGGVTPNPPSVEVADARGSGSRLPWAVCDECQVSSRPAKVCRILGLPATEANLLTAERIELPDWSARWGAVPGEPAAAAWSHVSVEALGASFRKHVERIQKMRLSPCCSTCGTRYDPTGAATTASNGAVTCGRCRERASQAGAAGVKVTDLAVSILAGLTGPTGTLLVAGIALRVGVHDYATAWRSEKGLPAEGFPEPWAHVDRAALRAKVLALAERGEFRAPKVLSDATPRW